MVVATKTVVHFNLSSGVTAPTAPFTAGTQVGVPTGTSLTNRATLGVHDGTESLTITHPVTGAQNTKTVKRWQGYQFTETVTPTPASGETWLFRNCRFDVPNTFWTCEVGEAASRNDQMDPLVVFDHCTFDGNDNTDVSLAGSFCWLIACDVGWAADAWQGGSYSVAYDCNIIAGTDTGNPDPHSDGFQSLGIARTTIYHCWTSAGASAGRNAALRFGTEFAASDAVDVRYCGIDNGSDAVQLRGDSGAGNITGVVFIGNRWTATADTPVAAIEATITTWTDNAFLPSAGGATIPSP